MGGSVAADGAADLVLQALHVRGQLVAAVLEEEVAVDEPGRVPQADELHDAGEEGEGVDGPDRGGGEPEGQEGAAGVDPDLALVLHGVPLLAELQAVRSSSKIDVDELVSTLSEKR